MATTLQRNPTKSVPVTIAGVELSLRFPAGVIEMLEDKHDTSMLTLVTDLSSKGVRVKMLLELVAAGTQWMGDDALTVDQLRDALDVGEVYALVTPLVAAITAGMPKAKPGESPNPKAAVQ